MKIKQNKNRDQLTRERLCIECFTIVYLKFSSNFSRIVR